MLHDVMAALRAGDTALALRTATDWARAEPGSADAQLALAHAHNANGDNAAASKALEHGLALAPDRADLLTARGFLELANRNFDGARADLDAALAANPNQMSAYIAAAHLAFSRSDLVEAERLISYARRIDDEHPHLLLLEAQLAELKGEEDRVLPLMSAAVQRAPNDALAQANLGLALLKRGHHAFAEQALRNALAKNTSAQMLRSALIAALIGQQNGDAALAEARTWVAESPESLPARWSLAQIAAQAGDAEAALDGCRAVLGKQPRHVPAFSLEMRVLLATGGAPAAVERLETYLQSDPSWDELWRSRIDLTPTEELPALIERWCLAAPQEPLAFEAAALLAERDGQYEQADALAEKALAMRPTLAEAALLRARLAQHLEPLAALARVDALIAEAPLDLQRRGLRGWRGLALHRSQRPDEALEAWRQMWTEGAQHGHPLPNPMPAGAAKPTEDGGEGWVLWGLPGSRVERVNGVLAYALPHRLLVDRWNSPRRFDGFNLLRVPADHAEAGHAAAWRQSLERFGMPAAEAIDAMPQWDAWTHATLHGTRLMVALRDPRDLLLNWMAWGSAAGIAFPGPSTAAAWLRVLLEQVLEAEAQAPDRVHRINADLLDQDLDALSARLQEILSLESAPDAAVAAQMALGPNGLSADFPAGDWRLYREALKPVFEHLQPVAVRLGYPAE